MSSQLATSFLQNSFFNLNSSVVTYGTYMKMKKFQPAPFNGLPTNVLLNIFKYFNEDELRRYIIPVCQHWRYTALHPALWKKLKIKGKAVPMDYICFQIRCFTNLVSITLDHVSEPTEALRQICRFSFNLKHLAVRNCSAIREITLRHVVKCCKLLEALDLQGTQFKGNLLFAELGGLKYLQALNLSENCYLTINNLLSVVLNCRSLENLQISKLSSGHNEQLCDEDLSFIMANISSALKCLELDTSNLTDLTFQKILQCRSLQNLSLYGASNLSGDTFSRMWKHLSKLVQLRVSYANHISGEHIEMLFREGQSVMQHLEVLDFTGCWKATDSSLQTVADCCPNLRHVTLKCCKSLTDISLLLNNCRNIEYLNIAFCNKLNMMKALPLPMQIKTIVIDENQKCKDMLEDITKDHKNIVVYISLSEYNNCMLCYN